MVIGQLFFIHKELQIIKIIFIIGIILFLKAIIDRVNRKEDDHYSKTVDK